ncbi:phage tail assembly chaperone GT [Salinicoccus sp. HZC-1]
MKDGKDINEMLNMPMAYMLSILSEQNTNMTDEEEERVLDRFLDSI